MAKNASNGLKLYTNIVLTWFYVIKTYKCGFNIFALVASIFKLKIGSKWYFYLNRNFLKTVFSNGYTFFSANLTPIDLKFSAYVPLDIIYGLTWAFLNAFFVRYLVLHLLHLTLKSLKFEYLKKKH